MMTAREELDMLLHHPSAALSPIDRAIQVERALSDALETSEDYIQEVTDEAYGEGEEAGDKSAKAKLGEWLKANHPTVHEAALAAGAL